MSVASVRPGGPLSPGVLRHRFARAGVVTVGLATLMSGTTVPAFADAPAPRENRAAFADTVDFGSAPTTSISDYDKTTFPCGGLINPGPSTDEVIATWSGHLFCPSNNTGNQSAIGFKSSVKQVEEVEVEFQMAELSRYNNVIRTIGTDPEVRGKLHFFLQGKDVVCTWKVVETDNRPGLVPDPVTIDCGGNVEQFTSANGRKYELDLRGFREGSRDGSGKVTCSSSNPLIQTWQTAENATTGACLYGRLVGVTPPPPNLRLKKSADKAAVQNGEVVTYTVEATNIGTEDIKPAVIYDDMTKVMDAAVITGAQTATIDGAPVAAPTYDAGNQRLTWSGDLPLGKTVKLTYQVRTNKKPSGDQQLDNLVTANRSNCEAGSTDAACTTNVKLTHVPLKAKKTVGRSTAEGGDTVTYTVEVENPGIARDEVEVVDEMTAVLDAADVTGSPRATVNGNATTSVAAFDAANKRLTWKGPLAAGAKLVLTYDVKVKNPLAGDKLLDNAVRVDDSNCESGRAAECRTNVRLVEQPLKVSKSVGQKVAGNLNTVAYTIVVQNPGADRDSVTVTDDLTEVLDAADLSRAPSAQVDGAPAAEPVFDPRTRKLTWTGPLSRGARLTLTYAVKTPRRASGDKVLDNGVSVPDSNCVSSSADATCRTRVPVAELLTYKIGRPSRPKAGQRYVFEVGARNNGKVDLVGGASANISDDMTDVLDDAYYNNDAQVVSGPQGQLTFRPNQAPQLNWRGELRAGEEVRIVYSITVKRRNFGNMVISNSQRSSYDLSSIRGLRRALDDGDENTGVCENGDPNCSTTGGIAYLQTAKTASPAKVKQGEKVTYTWTMTSTGKSDVEGDPDFDYVIDPLPGVLKYADYNNDVKVEGPGTVSYEEGRLKWTGPLKIGEKAVVSFSVTVRKDALKGLPKKQGATMTNTVNSEYNCWPGDPNEPPEDVCSAKVEIVPPVVVPPKPPVPPKPDPCSNKPGAKNPCKKPCSHKPGAKNPCKKPVKPHGHKPGHQPMGGSAGQLAQTGGDTGTLLALGGVSGLLLLGGALTMAAVRRRDH
ncbi:hypothetical protein GCM10010329_15550 [Streptomyces spiroverticillatus]|uniref:Gram-positive cocci surface proteins LPxTG domain-containing protein n=1 Tax=Streptomyces finlayi TaxID=67296 RepID=A0A919CCX6_9ACTN|nr:isopeptide-forming domain-containing fimbrial protein [Streptomyces finlayi]GGZ94890.1 hypothetical protein GCM10010329_15550 [Streptomyces spiroverticillatus]GHD07236.1 hypothetical protein GCM10010334_59580 [Streptomyces finlayi]